jgi:hypothetical protein
MSKKRGAEEPIHPVDAGALLLAAEADYLLAHGWKPTSILGPSGDEGPAKVWWSRKNATLQQAKAVALQKLEDPYMLGER